MFEGDCNQLLSYPNLSYTELLNKNEEHDLIILAKYVKF